MSHKLEGATVINLTDDERVAAKVYYIPGCARRETAADRNAYDDLALTPVQTHSVNVKVVESPVEAMDLNDTDAVATFLSGVPIGVRTADCVPILIYAEDVKGIAAIHAGWKGTLGGIVDNTLDIFEQRGADLSKLRVMFGPSISKECYEVDRDLADKFVKAGFSEYVSSPTSDESKSTSEYVSTPASDESKGQSEKSKPHIDLEGVNMERFLRRGIKRENIDLSKYCTFSSKDNQDHFSKDTQDHFLFPSYRRDKTTDRLLTTIQLLK